MKSILTILLALACAVLLVAVFFIKSRAQTQHDADIAALTEATNTLAATREQLASCIGSLMTVSNRVGEWQSALLSSSNNLVAAQATIALDAGQITELKKQAGRLGAENETLGRSIVTVTNELHSQIVALTEKVALTETNLADVQKDHVLLEERLRRDVAERLVIQRKFSNPEALRAQLAQLKDAAGSFDITADQIYAGLDVEVRSNGTIHVIAPQ